MRTSQAFPLTMAPTPHPSTVLGALVWRFLRRSPYSVLPLLGILWGVPTLMYVMLRMIDVRTAEEFATGDPSLKRLYFLLTMIVVPMLPLAELIKIRPLYTLPLTTRQIVHHQLGIGVVAVVVVHLLTVVYYQIAFGAPIPVFGPLLFLIPGLLMAAGLMSFLVDARLWKIPVALTLVGYFGYHGGVRFNDPALTLPGSAWFTPSPVELIVVLAAAVAGYLVTRHVADSDRRGDTRPWADVVDLWHRLVAWVDERRASRTTVPRETFFRSALAAQRSYEWQTRGLVLPGMALLGGLLSLIGAWFHPADWMTGYVVSIPMLLFLGMSLNGYFVGMLHAGRSTGTMDIYRATRPLTDTQLATIALKNGVRSTFIALLVTLGCAVIVTAYALLCGESPPLAWTLDNLQSQSGVGISLLTYVAVVVTAVMQGWALMGFNLSCVATGRHWLYLTIWFVVIGGILSQIVATNVFTDTQLQFFYWCMAMLFAAAASLGTIVCYRAAVVRRLIPVSRCAIGSIMWLTSTAFLLTVFDDLRNHSAGPPAAIALGALVALPLASAPLAVWWNRHR